MKAMIFCAIPTAAMLTFMACLSLPLTRVARLIMDGASLIFFLLSLLVDYWLVKSGYL